MALVQTPRVLFLFGSSGRLGSALYKTFQANPAFYRIIETISWKEEKTRSASQFAQMISALYRRLAQKEEADIIFANGLISPHHPKQEVEYSNFIFPTQVIEALRSFSCLRFMTIGSAMEKFETIAQNNLYMASKQALGLWIQKKATAPPFKDRLLHCQLHTLYEGPMPADHMFLGQMLQALKTQKPFQMSAGNQLREYHHVDDIAHSIQEIVKRHWDFAASVEINSGSQIRLKDLACAIFKAFHQEHLLRLGSLPVPLGENTNYHFARSSEWMLPQTRDTLPGVISWFSKLLDPTASLDSRHVNN